MRKLLIGALLLLIPLGTVAYENYKYQCTDIIAIDDTVGIRARDMNDGTYFRGYWTIANWSTNQRAYIEAHNLDGATGASADHIKFYAFFRGTYNGVVYCDSLYVINPAGGDSIEVWCHGDRAVGVYGP